MGFDEILWKLRKKRGISQKKLAEDLGMSTGIIGMYESGKRKPSYEALEQIADYFNVSIDYLTGRDSKSVYYLDPDVAEMAQEIYDNPELRILFDASRHATTEDLKFVTEMVKRMKGED
ncbi:MAG TPA: helix-turn-helix domain-containing protein [Candidatus Anaerostipes avicola]|uniref:Helix-turn-helix domain-containing protein n=1 Tax=Candidatus Anaerostipes avistercoris TaxID=2838462 RepID=A0A9D2T780_9FIRM|nr:helix-turn-helix domain-containing protein [Candidatus Anaerostipes avistercoris]HJC81912.1 helix-turn-helix domain-containing protein [Candidatus Anaerostipes avicola]